jgi:Siphovirus Gp157
MSNLVISQKAMALQNELELLDGEVTPEIESMMLEISKSADDAGLFLDRSKFMIEYFKDFKKKIDAKIKTIENAQEFVESELKKSIAAIGDLEGQNFIFKLQKTKDKVVIDDESKISDLFLRTKVTHDPDKTAIFDALKAGQSVDGAQLVPNFSLKKVINTKKLKG